jgi:ribosomal protein S18 acetylase RimI-like enzyme
MLNALQKASFDISNVIAILTARLLAQQLWPTRTLSYLCQGRGGWISSHILISVRREAEGRTHGRKLMREALDTCTSAQHQCISLKSTALSDQ